ncbi:MAG: hypothetical protein LQ338_004245 [Usnochroma carphineum]|nr:MAG: hypothetical protein LQ338_004245 [Usnochroma carphineum]
MDESSRSSLNEASRASTWEPSTTPRKKLNMQDPFDDQLLNWATLDKESPYFDFSGIGQAGPGSSYWQQPPPDKSYNPSLPSPLDFGNDVIPLGFNTQNTASNACYEQSDSKQPILETSRLPSTRQKHRQPQLQQQRKLDCPHTQPRLFNSMGPRNPTGQPPLPQNHSITSVNSSSSSSNSSSTGNAGQCITLCTQIISHLDSQTKDSSLGLDGVLRISKSCVSGLLQITTLESCKNNPNCLLLLCVAINQITTLFENTIPSMNSLLNSLSVSTLPSLLFGSFHVDQEDQLAFCSRLICREIQRCKQLLDRMSSIHDHHRQQQQSNQPDNLAHYPASLLQKQWFLALAGRLDNLAAAVTA